MRSSLLLATFLALGGCEQAPVPTETAAGPAAPPTIAAPPTQKQTEAPTDVCEAKRQEATSASTAQVGRVDSPSLAKAAATANDKASQANTTSLHAQPATRGGKPVSFEFQVRQFRLGPDRCLVEVHRLLTVLGAGASTTQATRIEEPTPEKLSATFIGWDRAEFKERIAGAELGEWMTNAIHYAPAELRVFAARGDIAGDEHGTTPGSLSGFVLVDPTTREAAFIAARTYLPYTR